MPSWRARKRVIGGSPARRRSFHADSANAPATYAAALAGVPSYRLELGPSWDVPKVYWTTFPRSVVEQAVARSREAGSSFFGIESADDFGVVVPDDAVAAAIDGTDQLDRKMAAMKAHATQITQDGPFFALSEEVGQLVWGWEYYRLAKGTVGPVDAESGRESDLFAGVAAS